MIPMKRIMSELRDALKRYDEIPVQIRATFWFLICAFLQKGISFITTPIFTRLLTTTEYGQFNIFNSWEGILTVFVSLNLYCGLYSRGVVTYEEDRRAFTSSLQGLLTVLVIAWGIIYWAFRSFWNNLFSLNTAQMLLMLVMIWCTNVLGFWSMSQRADFKYRKLVAVTAGMSLAKPLLGILFVLLARDKVTARIFGMVLAEAVICIALYWIQMRDGRIFFSAKYWKEALLFNIPLVPHYLSTTVLSGADRIMIGRMVGEASAGIYGLAYSISLIMTMFNTALQRTIEPWLYRKINERRVEDIAKVAYPSMILIAAVNLVLIALAPEVVAIFAPPAYYDAIWVIPPVAMSAFFMFSYFFFGVFEFYYKRTRLVATATCAGAALNVLLNYIFIQKYGYYAAGYTTLFCYVVYAMFHFAFMRKICAEELERKYPFRAKAYLCIACTFVGMGFLFLMSYPHRIVRYGLLCLLILAGVLLRKKLAGAVREMLNARKQED